MKITLTVAEIIDLAEFAGLTLDSSLKPDADDLETEIEIHDAHPDGAEGDDGERIKTRYVAFLSDYPEEGCMPLGTELKQAAPIQSSCPHNGQCHPGHCPCMEAKA